MLVSGRREHPSCFNYETEEMLSFFLARLSIDDGNIDAYFPGL
jgi:hypothetical protein